MSNIYASIIQSVAKAAEKNIQINEGDYIGEDGLYYCGKCHTLKQKRLDFDGQELVVKCLCKCEAEKRDKEDEERERIDFALRVEKLRYKAFSEERMREWNFANDDGENTKISNIARNFVSNWDKMRKDGKGLLFFGDTGTGKSFTAVCIANALIDRGIPCLVTNFSRIGNTLQGMFEGKQDYLDSLNDIPLLVLDDIRIERSSEYMQEIVYNVVDARCRSGLPLIVTTNLTSEELKNAENISCRRIYSRLFEICIPIEVKGVDRRRKKLKEQFADYSDLLGL